MDLHQQLDGTSSTPYISYQPSCTPYLERSRGRNPTSGSHNLGVKNGSWENSAIKGLQNLRRNSIQRKIFEQELAQAKTTESVKMELNQVRSITRRLLEAPTLPARKLSSSTPNLTLIGMDSDQLLGPPQNFVGQQRASSPIRIERRSQSPRLSPYPVSPAASSTHLSDFYAAAVPVDQLSGMRLSSPQPCYSSNASCNQMLGGSPQSTLSFTTYNNGYAQSLYGTDCYEIGSSPSPTVQVTLNGQQMHTDDGLKDALTNILDKMMHGGKEPGPIINSLPTNYVQQNDSFQSQQNDFNQLYYCGGASSPVHATAASQISNSNRDCGIQFPLSDNEVASYRIECSNQNCGTQWQADSQHTFIPQSNSITQLSAISHATPIYTSQQIVTQTQPSYCNRMDGLILHEPYGRNRAGSMPSLKMRTTETNKTAFCGSTVVDRVSKKQDLQSANLGMLYSVPTITVTADHESLDSHQARQKANDLSCDDLISFFNGEDMYAEQCSTNGKSVWLAQDIAGAFDTSLYEDQERWLLADNFARKELGLTTLEPDL